jgi:hypothetical protein
MGLFDWLQRKGSVGSVVRWAHKNYHDIKQKNPTYTSREICEFIFKVRFQSHPYLPDQTKIRLKKVESDLHLETIIELCTYIYRIEMDINSLDGDLYFNTIKNAQIVLEEENRKHGTDYK